ncbi:methylthioribose kinase-like [Lytechinus pictus]|uniref:methylthioribose kinase-like n=1 Tax=Lytechinus pictus TaxID=7653 RepID=UPI0030BA0B16
MYDYYPLPHPKTMEDDIFNDWLDKVKANSESTEKLQAAGFVVEVIGDGNLNDVHRVIEHDVEGKSVILKHAPPYIKCLGPEYPLSVTRCEIEYEALCWFNRIAPGSVPIPYHETSHDSFLMEDLRGYDVMKKQLVRGHLNLDAGKEVIRNIIRIHRKTNEGELGREKFDQLKRTFENTEMVSLTRDFIFTNPFLRDHPTNRCSPEVAVHLHLIYDNHELLQNASELRSIFLNKKDCLLHGDLHTGSVMTKDADAKMIDLEFAFVGPMGFDLGVLLANYLFSYHAHRIMPNNSPNCTKFYEKVRQAISDAISNYFGDAESRLSSNDLQSLVREVVGFTGCELIRRIVGAAHVEDLEGNPSAELECLKLGVNLLLKYKDIDCISASGLMADIGL